MSEVKEPLLADEVSEIVEDQPQDRVSDENSLHSADTNASTKPVHDDEELEQDPILQRYISACQAGDIVTVKELIESSVIEIGSDVDKHNVSGLHWAAINNRLSVLKYLVSKGAKVDAVGGDLDATPLHWACRYGLVYIVDYLLKQGADPKKTDSQGFNALHLAVHSSNIMLVIYMLICISDIEIDFPDPNLRTPLHWAAYQGDALSVDVLLKFKASVRKTDNQGFTPIHWALIRGQKDCLKRLIEEGADLKQQTNEGKDCFAIAVDMNNTKSLTSALYECGYDKDGNQIKRPLEEKWAKLICFFLPYIILGACVKIIATQNIIITLISFILIFFLSNFILTKFIFPSFILSSSSPLVKSPFLSGVFSGSAFWTGIIWFCVVLPNTVFETPISNLLFLIFFSSTIYHFREAMFKNPGTIDKPDSDEVIKQTIYDLLQEGKYDAKYFCINTFIRKPLRSKYSSFYKKCVARFDHYCPWVYNDIGLRNHKAFMFFVISLEFGIIFFLVNVFEYFDELDDDKLTCIILNQELCAAWNNASFTFVLTGWCIFQLIWLSFLLFSQFFQISKGLTTLELSNLTRSSTSGANPYYSSAPSELLIDEPSESSGSRNAARRNACSTFYLLTGIDQFIIAVRQTFGFKSHSPMDGIPFDYGMKQNLIDFWFASGDDHLKFRNFLKFPVNGEANLGGQPVDYYKLYALPPKRFDFQTENPV